MFFFFWGWGKKPSIGGFWGPEGGGGRTHTGHMTVRRKQNAAKFIV